MGHGKDGLHMASKGKEGMMSLVGRVVKNATSVKWLDSWLGKIIPRVSFSLTSWRRLRSIDKLCIIEDVGSIEGDGICILTQCKYSKCANIVSFYPANILYINKFPR